MDATQKRGLAEKVSAVQGTGSCRLTDKESANLVERLRNRLNDAPMPTERLLDDAADEIERLYTGISEEAYMNDSLRREIERLHKIIEWQDIGLKKWADGECGICGNNHGCPDEVP